MKYIEEKRPLNVPVLLEPCKNRTQAVNHGVMKPTRFIPVEKRSKDFGILVVFFFIIHHPLLLTSAAIWNSPTVKKISPLSLEGSPRTVTPSVPLNCTHSTPLDLNTNFQLLHSININTRFGVNNIPAPAVYSSAENSLTCVCVMIYDD